MRHLLWRAGIVVLLIFSPFLLLTACGTWERTREVIASRFQSVSQRYTAEADRLLAVGRKAEAILAYRHAVEKDPRNVDALRKLAHVYAEQGRKRLAKRYLQQAATLRPKDAALAEELQALTVSPSPAPQLKLLWQASAGEDVPVGMAIGEGVLYVSLESGHVVSLSAETGKLIWQTKLPTEATSAPAVQGELVFVGGRDGKLRALAAKDGQVKWEFATRGPIHAAPTVTEGTVYCLSGDGTVYALVLQDARVRWKFETAWPLRGQATLAGGVLYFGSQDTRIYAIDAASGARRWNPGVPTLGPAECPPAVAGGRVFVGSGDGRLYCLAAATGGEYWHYSTSDAIYARPLVIDDMVYVASSGQVLAALDVLSGKVHWELNTMSALIYSPAVLKGTLYFVANGDPKLYAVNRSTGDLLWQGDTGDWLGAEPIIVGSTLYLAGKDGTVLAYAIGS